MKPIVEHLKLQIRMNTKLRCVEVKVSEHTVDNGAIQKACDFVQAFMMGFEVQDAIALLRLDDLFVGMILLSWLLLKISPTLHRPRSNHPNHPPHPHPPPQKHFRSPMWKCSRGTTSAAP